jgi:hypothetical protein
LQMVFSEAASAAFIGINWHGLFAKWTLFRALNCKLFKPQLAFAGVNLPKVFIY